MEHLSQEQLDAMVMGTASREDDAVLRHLATCEACAHRLAREAQLESDLYDAAASAATTGVMAPARPAPVRMWRVALPAAAALAVVAFATWSVISREKTEVAPPRTTTVGPPSAHAPSPAGPSPDRGARELPPQDVCRCVTVEQSQGPPTDPGGSRLCTQSRLSE